MYSYPYQYGAYACPILQCFAHSLRTSQLANPQQKQFHQPRLARPDEYAHKVSVQAQYKGESVYGSHVPYQDLEARNQRTEYALSQWQSRAYPREHWG